MRMRSTAWARANWVKEKWNGIQHIINGGGGGGVRARTGTVLEQLNASSGGLVRTATIILAHQVATIAGDVGA